MKLYKITTYSNHIEEVDAVSVTDKTYSFMNRGKLRRENLISGSHVVKQTRHECIKWARANILASIKQAEFQLEYRKKRLSEFEKAFEGE